MTHGLDVWYTLPHKPVGRRKNTGSVKALRELGKLQRMVTTTINGTLRTSPTDLLDAHAGLLPMDLLLKKICFRSKIQVCTTPLTNPVSCQAVKYYTKPARSHSTNIQKLIELFVINPTTFKTVPAVSRPPTYQLSLDVCVTNSKEDVIEQEEGMKPI